jgi:polyamine oxidase
MWLGMVVGSGAGFMPLLVAELQQPRLTPITYPQISSRLQARLGGRVETIEWEHQFVELGAGLLYGTNSTANPLMKLVDAANVQRGRFDLWRTTLYSMSEGRELYYWEKSTAMHLMQSISSAVSAVQHTDSTPDVALGKLVQQEVTGASWDAVAAAAAEYSLHTALQRQGNGAWLESQSALYYDADAPAVGDDELLVKSAWLIEKLADGITVSLGQQVIGIAMNGATSAVSTADGREHTAQYVVCTAPLGVIKGGGIGFLPVLPPAMATALGHLRVGLVNKVALWFEEVFWNAYINTFGVLRMPIAVPAGNGSSIRWSEFLSMAAITAEPVLVAHASAESAALLEGMADIDIVADLLAVLRGAYGSTVVPAWPRHYHVTRWGSDPMSLGTHSYYGGERCSMA